MHDKQKSLLQLFLVFARIGTFAFGGGYVMIPMIQNEVTEKHGWLPKEKTGEVISISSSMPGAIAMNSALYVGYLVRGTVGAFVALAGCILPAIIFMTICVMFFAGFQDNFFVKAALKGIIPVVSGLMIAATYKLFQGNVKDRGSLLLCILSLIAAVILTFLNINTANIFLVAAILGVIIYTTSLSRLAFIQLKQQESSK